MPEYLHPGVYIEETERGPKPIEGVPTSTAAFLGETERGPTKPRLVTSYGEYTRWFGGVFGDGKFMPYAVGGFFANGGSQLYVARITDEAATPAEAKFGNFTMRAVGPGSWGHRLFFSIVDGSTKKPGVDGEPVSIGFCLMLAYFASSPTEKDLEWFDNPRTAAAPTYSEIFDDLETDDVSPSHWQKVLKDNSTLVELLHREGAPPNERPPNSEPAPLGSSGSDGAPVDTADFEGLITGGRADLQGLAALELDLYRDVALVYAPGAAVEVNRKVISHCENLRFRFAVIDPDEVVDVSTFQPRSVIADSGYAALYYPWITITDPQTGAQQAVPPGGHVLGVYARTDRESGVFKAPANQILSGVLGLTTDIDDSAQDTLNPRSVNCIRKFVERGIHIWGARTLTSDPLWKYVNVRRLLIFLERSIYNGLQWVVFEPDDEKLWARVQDSIRLFLRTQWRAGALIGNTEDEAFFVTCDRSTMTQDDILNGRLICEIGVAPVRPAEFVIFRIFQTTADGNT